MRSEPDVTRRARQRRTPLLIVALSAATSLAIALIAPGIEPWLGRPLPVALVLTLLAVFLAMGAFIAGRTRGRWSAFDELAWIASLGALGILSGTTHHPLAAPQILLAFALYSLAQRVPIRGVAALAVLSAWLPVIIRTLAVRSVESILESAAAALVMSAGFMTILSLAKRVRIAHAEREDATPVSITSPRTSIVRVSQPGDRERAPRPLNRNSSAGDEARSDSEPGWESLIERVRASVTGLAETAGVEASVDADVTGLAPPSQKLRAQLVRIAQEATTQALKLAEPPRSINVTLRRGEGGLLFELHDDSRAGETLRQRRAVASLRGRVAPLGGTAELLRVDRGWVTRVRLPCDQLN